MSDTGRRAFFVGWGDPLPVEGTVVLLIRCGQTAFLIVFLSQRPSFQIGAFHRVSGRILIIGAMMALNYEEEFAAAYERSATDST